MDLNTLYEVLRIDFNIDEFLESNDVRLKKHEIDSLKSFIEYLFESTEKNDIATFTENFIIGYIIPQIGEEFDLLRLGKNFNLNIELKSNFDYTKMKNQVQRKKHYLKFLEIPSLHISYSSDTKTCYLLKDDNLITIGSDKCFELLKSQLILNCNDHTDMDKYFDINDYLISPFNTTSRFLNKEYFLTSHQENIKKEIINIAIPNKNCVVIEGAAGTGKTLLLYDLILDIKKRNLKSVTFHCGTLNQGHRTLKDNGFEIASIKNLDLYIHGDYEVIFIDESQRMRVNQLKKILDFYYETNIPIIFSIDKEQCLHRDEILNDIRNKLNPVISTSYKLKSKIRTNKNMSSFIKVFFDHHIKIDNIIPNDDYSIKLKYFETYDEAEEYTSSICEEKGYKQISYATSRYNYDPLNEISRNGHLESSHKVIGQEFDKVVLCIDNNFQYKINESKTRIQLVGTGQSYYHSTKMLFQNMTRTRKELCLVFISNEQVFQVATNLLAKF